MKKSNATTQGKSSQNKTIKNASQDIDKLAKEADKERGRKPGSQSNSSDRHNTGRGGGK